MDYPYQMMYETTVDGPEQRRTDHTRWCTKQLLMVETKKSIPDDARNNCWWMRPMKDFPYQIVYKQLLMDERAERIHARWRTKQLLMDQTKKGHSIPDEVQNNFWWTRQMKESIPGDVQNNCWWWKHKENHTRWCTKQLLMVETNEELPHQIMYKELLMDERTDGIHARWLTKQMLMDQTKEGISIPDDVQNNCWWMRQMKDIIPDARSKCEWKRQTKQSIPDDARNNCLRNVTNEGLPIPDDVQTTVDGRENGRNPCQIMCETTVDGRGRWRNPY